MSDHDDDHDHDDHAHGGQDAHRHGRAWLHVVQHYVPFFHHHPPQADRFEITSSRRGIRATQLSLAGLGVTAVLQLIIVALSGSVALLADTAHNFADALTSVPLWLAFAIGARAATRRYTFGYGRLEDVAGVFIVLMIVSSGVLIVVASVQRLFDPPEVEALPLVMAAGVIGFLGNEAVAIYRTRVGREIGSAALVADGQHARADGLTSLGVLAGAIGVAAGAPIADPLVGLLIGVAILGLAWGSGVEVWYRLTDGVEPALVDELTAVVSVVEGVESVGQVRLRWTGHRLHAEVTARVHGDMPLSASHQIAEDVRHATLHARPELADSVVHVDPCEHFGLDDAHRQTEHHFGGA